MFSRKYNYDFNANRENSAVFEFSLVFKLILGHNSKDYTPEVYKALNKNFLF